MELGTIFEKIVACDVLNKAKHESDERDHLPLPRKKDGEIFAVSKKLTGGSRMYVLCEDQKTRLARIPGSMKRNQRIRTGDLLIIRPWDIQNERADILHRYSRLQSRILSRRNLIPKSINVF